MFVAVLATAVLLPIACIALYLWGREFNRGITHEDPGDSLIPLAMMLMAGAVIAIIIWGAYQAVMGG